ncbi:HD-GYP domain-containing protein [Photobacterium sp. 1_MG-2023]|uniref:HD-GYP domain-containing protein n=1 Tax=Photobacterium sp. 1_MG-2023 TaxID=3062646 RepID=UPI0026E2BC57|nr:HD-GYP domain-containing protein [Photobacterium sp. 1_MG-2023]MDO6706495.1 HD-GYP domain-containing protein [Photobacterium sp. 1_MG-2023]
MTSVRLPTECLTPGLYIKLPLQWTEHPFMLNHFKIKDEHQIRLIRGLGLKFVFHFPDKSDNPPLSENHAPQHAISDQETRFLHKLADKLWQEKQRRIEHLKNYKRNLQRCEKSFQRSLSQLRAISQKIKNRPVTAFKDASELVNDMVDALLDNDNLALHLMNDVKESEDIYYHSLNVAVLSMLLAKSQGMPANDIKIITLGALFHDIGKHKIPTHILRKISPLTEPEANFLKLHPKYSLELAELGEHFPEAAKPILSQHHELMDGTGYPLGLKGHQINRFAQLVAVVNAYDNLCHPMDPSKARIPYSALSYLFKHKKGQYSEEFIAQLVRMMGVYPPGSVVLLSNQQIGMVISVNAKRLLYPNILLYEPSVPSNEAPILDLEESELTIERALLPHKLPEPIRQYLNPRARISYYFDPES